MTDLATIDAGDLSYADPEAAIRWPLAEVVAATLDAHGRSQHSWRAYAAAIALFVDHLDGERGHLAGNWRPFVQKRVNGDLQAVTTDTGEQQASYVYDDAPIDVARKAIKCSMR
ncbi:hypothetical protein ACFLT5_00065 [Chloroflexota bacterium]